MPMFSGLRARGQVTADIEKKGKSIGLVSASPQNPYSGSVFLCYAPLRTAATFAFLKLSTD